MLDDLKHNRVVSENEMKNLLRDVDDVIRSQVVEYKLPLLMQAEHINHLENLLDVIKSQVNELASLHDTANSYMQETFGLLKEKQKQLEAIQKTSQSLRKLQKFLFLTGRLKTNYDYWKKTFNTKLSESPFVSQLKATLTEIYTLIKDPDLHGIDVVDTEMKEVSLIQSEIQKNTR